MPKDAAQTQQFTVADATSWSPATPLPLGAWRIWVRGAMADGFRTQWSLPTNTQSNAAPRLIPGPRSTFDSTPELSWEALPGAVSYEVYIRNLVTGQTSQQTGILGTAYSSVSEMSAGRYQWCVRGVNSLGYASRWSSGAVIEIGGRPTLISPTGTVSGQVTFSWFQVQGAERYELWVNRFGGGVGVINETVLTTAEFRTTSLSAGNYRVWVRAVSGSGQYSAWSQAVDFAVS